MKINELLQENSLQSLVTQDQRERNEYQNFVKTKANGDWDVGAKLYAKYKNRSENDIFGERERLEQFTKMQFDFNKFTKTDWKNYWLLAQHVDFNRNFQKQALTVIQKYLGANSNEYKYLYDRISCGLHGNQKFGTQDICNID